MFLAGEPFFFGGGDQDAVLYERGGTLVDVAADSQQIDILGGAMVTPAL